VSLSNARNCHNLKMLQNRDNSIRPAGIDSGMEMWKLGVAGGVSKADGDQNGREKSLEFVGMGQWKVQN
jgi:hypothetical protein